MGRKARQGGWKAQVPVTMADRIYEEVRNRLLAAKYPHGEFIREHEVAEGMGTSHTPVREALGRLATEGLLERIPHRGYRVPERATTDYLELVPVLSWVERLAVKLSLPHLTAGDRERLQQVNRQIVAAFFREDAVEVVRENASFHRILAEKCGNARLLRLLADLEEETLRIEFLEYARRWHRDRLVANHERIIQALEEKRFDDLLTTLEQDRLAALGLPAELGAER